MGYIDSPSQGGGSSAAGWQLVTSGTDFTSTDIQLTGLDGDTDSVYKLVIAASFASSSLLQLGLNGDTSASNYAYGLIAGGMDAGAGLAPQRNYLSAGNVARINLNLYGGTNIMMEIIISASTGSSRNIMYTGSEVSPNNNRSIAINGSGYYAETATNLTKIDIFANNAPTTGKYWLYKA